MAEHNRLGEQGEQIAIDYLVGLGYQIIEANWRKHKFEIDIIAQDENDLVIVEVKTRATDFFGNPEEAVTITKQKHLINGAECYIEENEIDLECRFDVMAIVLNSTTTINHIKDAFSPEFE